MAQKQLKDVRVAVLAADGFEQVEVTVPVKALRKQGADVRIVSLRPGRIRGVNLIWPGRKLSVDDTVFHANPDDYGALLLPGGFVNPDLLRQSEAAKKFVEAFDRSGKPIATLCHGPEVLISANLIRGRRLTSWPGIADDIRNAGGNWENSELVQDGNWISSRGPQDLLTFRKAMVSLFASRAPRSVSAPPRPYRWVAVLARTATLAALAAGAWRFRRKLLAAAVA